MGYDNKHSKIALTSSCLPKFRDAPPKDLRERCAREKKYTVASLYEGQPLITTPCQSKVVLQMRISTV